MYKSKGAHALRAVHSIPSHADNICGLINFINYLGARENLEKF